MPASSVGYVVARASPCERFLAGRGDASSVYTVDDPLRIESVNEELLLQAAQRWQERGSPEFVSAASGVT